MRQVLSFLFLLSAASLTNAENLPTPASSTSPNPSSEAMPASPTGSGTGATGGTAQTEPRKATRASKPAARNAATAQFNQDLAGCKQLESEERRLCERETWAARYEGLYRE